LNSGKGTLNVTGFLGGIDTGRYKVDGDKIVLHLTELVDSLVLTRNRDGTLSSDLLGTLAKK
jgi:hypothetical protein